MPAGTKRFALSFKETMWGTYKPRGEDREESFHFTIHAHGAEKPRDDWEITGTIYMPGIAENRPLIGNLTMPRGELRYDFRFMDDYGTQWHFLGSKYPNFRQVLRSRTHIDQGALYQEGQAEPWAEAKAVFRGPWIPFYLSFGILRRTLRPADKKPKSQKKPPPIRQLKHQDIALALASAAFPGSDKISAADMQMIKRLKLLLNNMRPLIPLYDAMLMLLDVLPRLINEPRFSKQSKEKRPGSLTRLSSSALGLPGLLLRALIMPMKLFYMTTDERHEAVGCKFGKDPIQPEEPAGWTRQIHPASEFDADEVVDADVVVVGSGAGGAVVAKELAEKGLAVVMVESGPFVTRESFSGKYREMLPKLYRFSGTNFSIGNTIIPLPIGNVVGGTTLINSGTCFRTPDDVLETWVKWGLKDFEPSRMEHYFERVESFIKVAPAERDVVGPIADIIGRGADAMGYSHGPLLRYAPDCTGDGVCQVGCSADAKQSTNLSYVPAALKSNAVLYPEFKVRRILTNGSRAVGLTAYGRNDYGKTVKLTVLAKAVVLSAGTLLTPMIIQQNGLARGNPWVGRNLSIHPAGGCTAHFPGEQMRNGATIPQGYSVDQFHDEGILFEGGTINLDGYSLAGPLMGQAYMDYIERYQQTAFFGFMIDDQARGSVRPGPRGRPLITYSMTGNDIKKFSLGVAILAKIFFAAGAESVSLNNSRMPVAWSPADVDAFLRMKHRARDFLVSAYHPLGTARIGADPKISAANPDHQLHNVPGLFVVDGSAVPSSVGVNPMVTIMAVATRAADRIAQTLIT